jgi:hypothetical protein
MRAVSLGSKESLSKGNLSPGPGNDTDSEGPPAQRPPAHCRRWQSRWRGELAILPLPLSWGVQPG